MPWYLRHGNQNAGRYHDGTELPTDGTRCSGQLDRGWGKPKEMHHSEVDDNKTLLKVVNEIVHVHETREQIEFNDQTPLLEINPMVSKAGRLRSR